MKKVKEFGYYPIIIFITFGCLLLSIMATDTDSAEDDDSDSNPGEGSCEIINVYGPQRICVNEKPEYDASTRPLDIALDWESIFSTNPHEVTRKYKTSWNEPGDYEIYVKCPKDLLDASRTPYAVRVVEVVKIQFFRDGVETEVAKTGDTIDLKSTLEPVANDPVIWEFDGPSLGCQIAGSQIIVGDETGTVTIKAKDKVLWDERGVDCNLTKDLQITDLNVDVTFSAINSEDSVKEEEDGTPNETTPYGGYLCLNDNDNARVGGQPAHLYGGSGDGIDDRDQENLENEDPDLKKVSFFCGAEDEDEGTLTVSWPGYVKLWKDAQKQEEITQTPDNTEFDWPDEKEKFNNLYGGGVFAEAIEEGRGGQFNITFEEETDNALVTVIYIHLDTDHNNDGEISSLDDGPENDLAIDDELLARMLRSNINDFDSDGIPDYADGFDLQNFEDDRKIEEFDNFEKVLVKVPSGIDYEILKMKFVYDEASTEVEYDEEAIKYTKPNGKFRVWIKKGDEERNKNSITDGGDFVPSGAEVDFSELASSTADNIKEIYIEGINFGQDQIKCILVKDGSCQDAIYFNVFDTKLKVWTNKDGERVDKTYSMTDNKFIPEINFSVSNIRKTQSSEYGFIAFSLSGNVKDYASEICSSGQITSLNVKVNGSEVGQIPISYSTSNSIWKRRTLNGSFTNKEFSYPFDPNDTPEITVEVINSANERGFKTVAVPFFIPTQVEDNYNDYITSASVGSVEGEVSTISIANTSNNSIEFTKVASNSFEAAINKVSADMASIRIIRSDSVNNKFLIDYKEYLNDVPQRTLTFLLLGQSATALTAANISLTQRKIIDDEVLFEPMIVDNEVTELKLIYHNIEYNGLYDDGKFIFEVVEDEQTFTSLSVSINAVNTFQENYFLSVNINFLQNSVVYDTYSTNLSKTNTSSSQYKPSNTENSNPASQITFLDPVFINQSPKSFYTPIVLSYDYFGKEFNETQTPFKVGISSGSNYDVEKYEGNELDD